MAILYVNGPDDDDGDGDAAAAGRVRRFHTRSRTGCLTCRKRHVRCDEGRPHCVKCVSAGRACEYQAASVPLRDRRGHDKDVLPGQQRPWSVSASTLSADADADSSLALVPAFSSSSSTSSSSPPDIPWHLDAAFIDPFGTLPINMVLKSKELLHYFHQAGDALNMAPKERKEDCLARATLDPYALRNTLLLASLHYAWLRKGFDAYLSTYLFHKGETIRMINHAIAKQGSRSVNDVACARQIATLSFTEGCLANTPAADAHLNGLTTYLEYRDAHCDRTTPRDEVEEDLLVRYLIITWSFVHTIKSRSNEFPRKPLPTDEQTQADPEGVRAEMERWRRQERLGLMIRLKAVRMFPFFFSQQPSGRKPRDIDVYKLVRCCRPTAIFIERKQTDPSISTFGCRALDIWDEHEPAEGLFQCLETLRKSLAPEAEDDLPKPGGPPRVMSSWGGAVAVIAFFYNSVCGIANEGKPIDARLHRRVLNILRRDVEKFEPVMRDTPGLDRDLWLWKVFNAAMSLEMRRYDASGDSSSQDSPGSYDSATWLGVEDDHDALRIYYEGCVRTWCGVAGVSRWEDAEEALLRIAWPKLFPNLPFAKLLWERCSRP